LASIGVSPSTCLADDARATDGFADTSSGFLLRAASQPILTSDAKRHAVDAAHDYSNIAALGRSFGCRTAATALTRQLQQVRSRMSQNLANYIGILLLGGLLGVIGQGVRAVVGLKKMFDQAQSQDVGPYDLFLASRLLISLFIGFVAGALAAFFSGIKADGSVDVSTSMLTAFAAAGYTGTDFIEGLASRFARTPNPGQEAQARPRAAA
jgi:hypothetical protein